MYSCVISSRQDEWVEDVILACSAREKHLLAHQAWEKYMTLCLVVECGKHQTIQKAGPVLAIGSNDQQNKLFCCSTGKLVALVW